MTRGCAKPVLWRDFDGFLPPGMATALLAKNSLELALTEGKPSPSTSSASMRPSWSGYLRLSLVSVPVQAFTADEPDDGGIRFNQLHEKCHRRIQYKKFCPVHGEVTKDE